MFGVDRCSGIGRKSTGKAASQACARSASQISAASPDAVGRVVAVVVGWCDKAGVIPGIGNHCGRACVLVVGSAHRALRCIADKLDAAKNDSGDCISLFHGTGDVAGQQISIQCGAGISAEVVRSRCSRAFLNDIPAGVTEDQKPSAFTGPRDVALAGAANGYGWNWNGSVAIFGLPCI